MLMDDRSLYVKSDPGRTHKEGTQGQGRGVISREVYWREFKQEDIVSRFAVWRRRRSQRRKSCGEDGRGKGGGGVPRRNIVVEVK